MPFENKIGSRGFVILAVLLIAAVYFAATYNALIRSDQQVQSQWAQVENAYQRRLDLVPNLVATVKGAAEFEKSTFTAVTEARSAVGEASPAQGGGAAASPAAFAKSEQAQDGLTSALSRLIVVVEQYPDLKATQNFLDLQAQLEGTENRISVERMRFNDAAQAFNSKRDSFPTNLVANLSGERFQDKTYFKAEVQADTAPQVKF